MPENTQRMTVWGDDQSGLDASVSSSHDSTASRSALRAAAFGSASSAERLHLDVPCRPSSTSNGNQAESLEEDMATASQNQGEESVRQTTDESNRTHRNGWKKHSRDKRIEKAKQSREWAIQQTKDALAELEESLRNGKSEILERYLQVLGRFHNYSYRNLLLIVAQRPEATQVAGFSTWKKLGRKVMKGEKGIRILAPVKYSKSKDNSSKLEKEGDDKKEYLTGFKCVRVFDISQTEGKALPEFSQVKGDPGEYLERLKTVVEESGISVEVKPIPGGAQGRSTGGTIEIAPGQSPEEFFATLAHEYAHELIHFRQSEHRSQSKSVRETEAEAVAFAVCHAIGLDAKCQSTDYIHLYQGNAKLLQESLSTIQETASWIIGKTCSK